MIYNFEWDLFADGKNAKTAKFMSLYYESGSQFVDAFTANWNVGVLWVCPPVGSISKVVSKIKNSKCQGILIVPDWPAQAFYCTIFHKENDYIHPFKIVKKFKPYIFQNEGATKTPLFGYTEFDFFALYFNTL